jgi:predicted transcriptional regulator
MKRIRKSAVQIRFEMLEFLFLSAKPQLRTAIWRKSTNSSYDAFSMHLSYLEEKKLVRETEEGHYLLTENGRKLYIELHKLLPSIL